MVMNLVNKAHASGDVIAGWSLSGLLTTSPLWVGPLTGGLQVVALLVGILVGISSYRLNTVRRVVIEDD